MRRALVVGIDYYEGGSPLFGCVNDAHSVKAALDHNSDGTPNFDVMLLTGTGPSDRVTRTALRSKIQELFADPCEVALFYFAGHGHVESTGGYLLATDSVTGDDGVALNDILTWANASSAQNKVILLDSCHSGIAGAKSSGASALSELSEGLTILTASTAEQYATEENGSGVFTTLLVDALSGAAGDLLGNVTPGSVYAHVDRSLGAWDQRPIFKTNIRQFVSLRSVQRPIPLEELRRISEFFPSRGATFRLDPTYEPERSVGQTDLPDPIESNTKVFAILQRFNRLNLVVPLDAAHMWHAAMRSTGCRLTVLGEHFRTLVVKNRV